ncbi:hypothetical protein [Chamaesiphon sp. VAR_48_metabat_135_sub]|uniref:hypothetical protein n=1 Tax=Chamaesiphon sp. VAR_48_metabat_135_sub TaxID=2964699 RepID=UPI00286B3D62|nr:hypothetical protein [Chamaesiphon sp. VAR_48_metabat_135_sub]
MLKLLSVASLTGSIVGLLVSASWMPSAQAFPCSFGAGDLERQIGWSSNGVPMCEKKWDVGGSNSGSSLERERRLAEERAQAAKRDAQDSIMKAMQGNLAERERIIKSPAYRAYMDGSWEFPQRKNGESCAAIFWRKDVMFLISGPGKDNKDAFLTYFGPDVPRPQSGKKVNVTLTDSSSATKTVKAFNFKSSGSSLGSIVLGIPSIDAAVAAMQDTGRMDLAMDGKSVANIEWHSGFAARDRLRQCLSARANK